MPYMRRQKMSQNKIDNEIDELINLLDNQISKGTGHINVFQTANSDNLAFGDCPCTACQVPTLLDIADEDTP